MILGCHHADFNFWLIQLFPKIKNPRNWVFVYSSNVLEGNFTEKKTCKFHCKHFKKWITGNFRYSKKNCRQDFLNFFIYMKIHKYGYRTLYLSSSEYIQLSYIGEIRKADWIFFKLSGTTINNNNNNKMNNNKNNKKNWPIF